MSAVPKSLGVLPPFVLQYDPSNAPVVQVAVSGGGLTGPAALRLRAEQHRAAARRHPRRGQRRRSTAGGSARSTSSSIRSRPQARGITSTDVAAAVAQSNALLPSGEFISPKFDANVYTNAVARAGRGHRRRGGQASRTASRCCIRDVARVEDGGSPETQAVAVERPGRRLPQRAPRPRRQHARDRRRGEEGRRRAEGPAARRRGEGRSSISRRSCARRYHGLEKEVVQALVLIALVILLFLQSVRGTLIVVGRDPALVRDHAHRPLRDAGRR